MNAEVINLSKHLAKEVGDGLAAMPLLAGPLPDEESVERHAGLFRRFVSHFSEKAAAARRACKAEMKEIAAERKAMAERYRQELAAIDDREAEARARGAEQEAAAQRLADCYRDALATAEGRL